MVDSINGINTGKVDISRWKKLTAQEIIKEKSRGEDVPAELLTWAQQMAAFAKIPDDVTYEQVDGDVGIDALSRLGIEDEEATNLEAENAQKASETEDPDAVKDPNKAEEADQEDVDLPESETANEADKAEQAEFSLANSELTADNDEIRKRKERKGIL